MKTTFIIIFLFLSVSVFALPQKLTLGFDLGAGSDMEYSSMFNIFAIIES